MKLASWNTQGDFTETTKAAEINGTLKNMDVIMIQEGGVDKTWSHVGFKSYAGVGVGAFNERCTNYILVSDDFREGKKAIYTTLSNIIGGGDAGRSACAVQIDHDLFISWHSIASSNNSDTSQLIDKCLNLMSGNFGLSSIVIGGDFNTDPSNVEMMIAAKAASQKFTGSNFFVHVFNGGASHSSGKTYDFFVVFTASNPAYTIGVQAVVPSDHNPVAIDVPI